MGQSIVRVFYSWSRQKTAAHLVAAVVVCAFSGPAQAARVNLGVFHDFGSGIDPALVDIWVGVQNAGNDVRFVIHNDSAITSSVTHVYFESPLGVVRKSGGQNRSENGSTGGSALTSGPILPRCRALAWWVSAGTSPCLALVRRAVR